QCHKPIQLGIACLVDGPHPADTERFDYEEMFECSLHADPFTAVRTWDACQWFCRSRIDRRSARGTCLGGGLTRHGPGIVTFAFQKRNAEKIVQRFNAAL